MTKTKRINLALQGGGAHGAFTWGVLDHLLEQETLEICWISAASAGAINAVALASGMAQGGREGARAKLRQVWKAIYDAGVPDFIRLNPLLASLSAMPAVAGLSKMFSPYEFNPMGFDPLRKLLTDTIDFDHLRSASPIELLIAATDVSTGRPRFFHRAEMTVDAVLASACLPTLHHAVEIEGRAYWDGGFSANPDLVHLALQSPVNDTLIVLLNPTHRQGTPTNLEDIASQTNRLTFNAPLMRDIQVIEAVREAEGGWLQRKFKTPSRLSPLATHRFHLIEAGRHASSLPAGSKMKPDWVSSPTCTGLAAPRPTNGSTAHARASAAKAQSISKPIFYPTCRALPWPHRAQSQPFPPTMPTLNSPRLRPQPHLASRSHETGIPFADRARQ